MLVWQLASMNPPVPVVIPKQLAPLPLMSAPLRLNSVPTTNEPYCFMAPSCTPASQPSTSWLELPDRREVLPNKIPRLSRASTSPQPPPTWAPKYTPDQL
jgi:hypothetical protein